ncbi:MAG TPA: Na+/H+ antiporter subunit E [Nocardioidaceae bacterium]|nr:Na+/H+ antiporter subunit E [Nocardioidaceae bacterium]
MTESHASGARGGGAVVGDRGLRGWRERLRRPWRDPAGWRRQLPLLVGLMVLWMLLWDDVSWGNVVNGAVIAVVLTRVFYLPPAELSGRVNLYWLVVFFGHFLLDLARSSLQVARLALSFGHIPRNAVIAVRLHTSSDLVLTVLANTLSLIPGSSTIDVDRRNTTLYVHLLDANDDEGIENDRRHIMVMEERVIRALGSREDYASLQQRTADGQTAASRADGGGADR